MSTIVDNLTNSADQLTILILGDGTTVSLELLYHGATQRWVANITYGNTTINGLGLCCSPNILRQWRNVLPFGLAIVTTDQTDPFSINDFSSGRVLIYLLNAADVIAMEDLVFTAP